MSDMKYKITSRFHEMESFRNHPHNGVDLKMEIGEPLRAIQSGRIHFKDFGNVNAGKTVLIESEDGRTYIYGHLSEFANLKEGQNVEIGDLVGYAGNSGFSTGSHLHFGVREGNSFIDPSPYMDSLQNMNNPQWIASHAGNVSEIGDQLQTMSSSFSLSDIMSQYMSSYAQMLSEIKFNLINLFTSVDYTVVIHHLQNLFQFFS
jgi:hypothetical protein